MREKVVSVVVGSSSGEKKRYFPYSKSVLLSNLFRFDQDGRLLFELKRDFKES